jgi:hypothetical protein
MNGNRAFDYGSKGFEGRKKYYGPVAQLNRAFDYGSKGFRFES